MIDTNYQIQHRFTGGNWIPIRSFVSTNEKFTPEDYKKIYDELEHFISLYSKVPSSEVRLVKFETYVLEVKEF